jgi:beta-glucosidase
MTRRVVELAVRSAVLLLFAASAGAQQPAAVARPATRAAARRAVRPWMNAELPVARRAQLLLRAMTLEEKFWQLYMAPGDPRSDSTWKHGAFGVQLLGLREPGSAPGATPTTNAVQRWFVDSTRLGVPVILFEEGVHGLLQMGATVYPAAIGLAATWDTALVRAVAGNIADQSRQRGIRLLLAPVVNLARDPRWGRVEETYGEDAWLSSAMGAAFAGSLERNGVVATPKHFVANHGDGGRDSYPVALDQATLEDLYFPPFRAAIDRGGARAIMASYNSVNGVPASASPQLLTRTLRGDWKFNGIVMSDQAGVGGANVLHHTAADYAEATAQSVNAGLDVIFQSGAREAALFWPAFRDGRIARAKVDTAVARVLRLKFALGLFEQPYADSASRPGHEATPIEIGAAIAMRAAEESAVLLKNAHGLLPLSSSRRRVALIGPAPFPLGGYTVQPNGVPTLADVWTLAGNGETAIAPAPGPGITTHEWLPVAAAALTHDQGGVPEDGLRVEYFRAPDFAGEPAVVRTDRAVDFRWTFNRAARGVGADWFSARWTGTVIIPAGDSTRLAVEGDDGYRLWLDDSLVIDGDNKVSYSLRATAAAPAPGKHRLRLEYRQTTGNGRLRLLWQQESRATDEARIAEAVAVARRSDVAVISVGVDEGEFRDRASLHLPGRQEELIERVAATGTPVVVLIAAGGAVIATPWIDHVDAVVQVFYPGQSSAEGLSRLLHGKSSPAGRLPYTVPRSEGQLPLVYDHLPTGRGDWYVDLAGEPLFPFGFGLSYTTFEYSELSLSAPSARARDTVHVRFRVKNTGTVASDEVPQLYVRHVTAPTAQPVLALRGFARIPLQPSESRDMDFPLAVTDLAVRDLDGTRRVVPHDVVLYVGASSRDLRLRGTLRIQ